MHTPRLPAHLAVLLLLLAASACGDDGTMMPPPDAGPDGVQARFDLLPDPMPLGSIPFPDDLYLDEAGRIALGAIPGEDGSSSPGYHDSLRVGLADLDGFGVVTPTYFYFDGELDPSSLPVSPEMSLLEDASVFMVDVDPASASRFARVPVEVHFEPTRQQLAVRPANGHPLRAGGRYAVVVTTEVMGTDMLPIRPADSFAALRDALTRPEDALLGEAYDHYTEVLASLATNGVTRESVAALAHFRVQSVTDDLVDARAAIWADDAPAATLDTVAQEGTELDALLGTPRMDVPGLDVEAGVRHGAIGWMIHGSFESPSLISDALHVHGRFQRGADGSLSVRSTERVPFTIFLPRGDLSDLPLALFQHGLGAERSNALAFADALCADGYAVLAMDIPWHGMRNPAAAADLDVSNRFTGEMTPDGFGDVRGLSVVIDFVGITDDGGELAAFHPNYMRDTLRQAAVDLMSFIRLARDGDWAELRAADPGLAMLGFSSEPIALIGYSLGGIIATQLAAIEPEIGVAVLSVTGGSILQLVSEGPIYNRGYLPILLPKLDIVPSAIDYAAYHPRFMPELAIWQTLLDRGDSIAYARTLAARNLSVLMPMARHDENLHNIGTESLARAIGAEMIGDDPLYADIPVTTAPLRDNVSVDGEMVTRAVYVWDPASHGLMLYREDETVWAHPIAPPFAEGDRGTIANPIDEAQSQLMHFLQSFRTGTAEVVDPR